jgi:hypothetical protein
MGHVVPFLLGAVQRVRVPAHVPSHVGLAAAQRRPDGEGGVGAVQREARVDRRIRDADGDVVTAMANPATVSPPCGSSSSKPKMRSAVAPVSRHAWQRREHSLVGVG